jgi:hypothetical protein
MLGLGIGDRPRGLLPESETKAKAKTDWQRQNGKDRKTNTNTLSLISKDINSIHSVVKKK